MTKQVDSEELGEKCDFDRCHCVPAGDNAIVDADNQKTVFCSVGCQQGRGCECDNCNCVSAS